MNQQQTKPQFFISNADHYYFVVDQDLPVNKDELIALGCTFHETLEDLYIHVCKNLRLEREEVAGGEIVLINSDGTMKESQHAYFSEIDLEEGESLNHYIAKYIN